MTVLKYQVITYIGDVHQPGTEANVFVCLYGSLGSSGKRLLKQSLTNKERFTQDQVSQVLSLQEITLTEDDGYFRKFKVCKRLQVKHHCAVHITIPFVSGSILVLMYDSIFLKI